jgi:hypothetical protein
MAHAPSHVERAAARTPRKHSPPRSAPVDAGPLTSASLEALQRVVGNQVTVKVVQRELKIDSYAWSYMMGVGWGTGAEALHKKLKKAFETDLPDAVKLLDATGEADLKQLADKLRAVKTKYDDQPLVYKKTSGKLSGEELDSELSPLLAQVDKQVTAKKGTLVNQIRDTLGIVGPYIGGQLKPHEGEYRRIGGLVPKGSDGSIQLDVPTLRKLAGEATVYESKMQVELQRLQAAKQTQSALTTPSAKSTATSTSEIDELKNYLKKEKGWSESQTSAIFVDMSDIKLKKEVCQRVVGGQIGALNQVLKMHGLTLEAVHNYMVNLRITSIEDLNVYLTNLGGAKPLAVTLQTMGLDGLTNLLKRKVPGDFIGQHAGEDMLTIYNQYKASIVTTPTAKVYDPFEGVDANKDPLDYSTLEAFLQFHTGQIQSKVAGFTLRDTYNSSYDGEHGIGGEYWPNNTSGHWVVHVHRGPMGGLKVGSIKTWADRGVRGHSQKLTVDKLTAAGILMVDPTRLH